MEILQFLLIGISLSMDAFAISLCQGFLVKDEKISIGMKLGFTFGIFQAIMPWIGYSLGNIFSNKISAYGNFLAFIILVIVGGKMIKEAGEEESCSVITNIQTLLILGVVTSIDALAVGFTFSLNGVSNINMAISIIGFVTFLISFSGVFLGKNLGDILGNKAHYLGGGILILLGLKSLIENFI